LRLHNVGGGLYAVPSKAYNLVAGPVITLRKSPILQADGWGGKKSDN